MFDFKKIDTKSDSSLPGGAPSRAISDAIFGG